MYECAAAAAQERQDVHGHAALDVSQVTNSISGDDFIRKSTQTEQTSRATALAEEFGVLTNLVAGNQPANDAQRA